MPPAALPQSRCRQPFLVVFSATSRKRTRVAAERAWQLVGTFEAASAGLVVKIGAHIGRGRMNTYDRISTQARELKELAKRFNVTVLPAVQVNREAGGDGLKGTRPRVRSGFRRGRGSVLL